MALVLLGSSFLAAPWTHASDWQEPIQCTTAVVGGGWAGVYSAWRLALDAAAADASSVCLFEARQAVGGRTYSVDLDGLTIDIGAYRFGMSMHLPADLIVNHFKLKTVCYEPSCSPDAEMNATLYRIVAADGHNAGYATPVRAMLREALGRGVRVFYRHELTGIYDGGGDALAEGGASLLHFAGGGVARASAVLLNLPRQAVERLDPASVVFDRGPSRRAKLATTILTNCTPCQAGPVAEAHEDVKVYAIYDHPWWVSKLGLAEGTFASVDADPPLVGRYHDGPIRRRGKDAPGPAALEAVYTFTLEHPQVKWRIHLANNDFTWTGYQGKPCCWAEQSLRAVERILVREWALPRPAWLDKQYWTDLVGEADATAASAASSDAAAAVASSDDALPWTSSDAAAAASDAAGGALASGAGVAEALATLERRV
ncbi:hypothetical protein EMIHUDRAFT_111788 [Emiliania huxleyi CCMP1516]|uniref:Amine oxidase domain-containing protein n=2 Tax=Emiliania huxleyi TaxID=2903 RepID=A0A0D3KCM6_EMIH1|nr:hypothetical protein EMIHUDRAFT_111788 [Emiliania huxleyi CCMP1516]EOD33511.1 hypothetical protein EMIHUDRAFT_111788 [Emiliania huxleyi CCMP1516]|eukprot:XP_005785940.1 hypothetical protein EMIHUDRAFT_111788 [Emiliania huxleyi CCMP1516]